MSAVYPRGMVIVNRETGLPVGPAVPIGKEDQFYRHARLETKVWRYMEGWKFEKMLNEKALYFRRSDKLEDEMEGKYAEANRVYATKVWKQFTTGNKIEDDPRMREEQALHFRYRAFINCWHVNRVESPKMWKDYCKTEDSLVVVSTVRQVITPLQKRKGLAVGRVRYEHQSVVRPEWSVFAPLFFKDPSFYQEKEYRLVVNPDDPYADIDLEEDLGVFVPIEPAELVNEIFVHPNARSEFKDKVKELASGHKISGVHNSRLPKDLTAIPSRLPCGAS